MVLVMGWDGEGKTTLISHLIFGLGSRYVVGTECRPELLVPASRLIFWWAMKMEVMISGFDRCSNIVLFPHSAVPFHRSH